MRKCLFAVMVLAAATAFLAGCDKPTKLIGTLILQTGQSGDVQNCRVELYEKADLTGDPVKEVASKQNTTVNSPFEFTDVIEGYYYVLAWKDLNGDGKVSDKDIVGIKGGTYRPGYGGSMTTVSKGKTTDVGEIVMMIYKDLVISATGTRTQGGTVTDFTYQFNYDLNLTSLTITFPGYNPIADPDAPGAKTAGTVYRSEGWHAGGAPMPTGNHTLSFVGTWEGTAFSVDIIVGVN